MKTTIALLLIILSFSTLTSCKAEYIEPSCNNCGGNGNTGNNGGNSSVVFDELSDPPTGSNFHSDSGRLIQYGFWNQFSNHIITANGNYIALKLVPVYDLNGYLKMVNGEQLYSVESFQYSHH